MNGGYDDGYRECSCFWGSEPGSLVRALGQYIPGFANCSVLDAGCGEGKNAAFLAAMGAKIDAVDISFLALENGLRYWSNNPNINWIAGDVRSLSLPQEHYDIVIAYGLLHCLSSIAEVYDTLKRLQRATRKMGYHVICAFNNRRQDLHAHPGFAPTLLSHSDYVRAYSAWEIVTRSDADLTEKHPHNEVEHTHSLTRILARKVSI